MPRTTRRTRAARAIAAATGRSYQAALEQRRTGRPEYTVTGPLPADALLAWVLTHHTTTPMTVIGDTGSGWSLAADVIGQTEQHHAVPDPLPAGQLILMGNLTLSLQLNRDGGDALLHLLTGRDLAPDLRTMRIGEALVLTPPGETPPSAGEPTALREAALDALRAPLLDDAPLAEGRWLRADIWPPADWSRGDEFRLRLTVLDAGTSHISAREVSATGLYSTALWALHRSAGAQRTGGWTHARILRTPEGRLMFEATPTGAQPPAVSTAPVDVRMAPGSGKSTRMVHLLVTGVDPAGFQPR